MDKDNIKTTLAISCWLDKSQNILCKASDYFYKLYIYPISTTYKFI